MHEHGDLTKEQITKGLSLITRILKGDEARARELFAPLLARDLLVFDGVQWTLKRTSDALLEIEPALIDNSACVVIGKRDLGLAAQIAVAKRPIRELDHKGRLDRNSAREALTKRPMPPPEMRDKAFWRDLEMTILAAGGEDDL